MVTNAPRPNQHKSDDLLAVIARCTCLTERRHERRSDRPESPWGGRPISLCTEKASAQVGALRWATTRHSSGVLLESHPRDCTRGAVVASGPGGTCRPRVQRSAPARRRQGSASPLRALDRTNPEQPIAATRSTLSRWQTSVLGHMHARSDALRSHQPSDRGVHPPGGVRAPRPFVAGRAAPASSRS